MKANSSGGCPMTTGVQVWEVGSGGSTLLWEGFDPQGVGFYTSGRYLWSIVRGTATILLFDVENRSEIGELRAWHCRVRVSVDERDPVRRLRVAVSDSLQGRG